jgi:hypothetical protein
MKMTPQMSVEENHPHRRPSLHNTIKRKSSSTTKKSSKKSSSKRSSSKKKYDDSEEAAQENLNSLHKPPTVLVKNNSNKSRRERKKEKRSKREKIDSLYMMLSDAENTISGLKGRVKELEQALIEKENSGKILEDKERKKKSKDTPDKNGSSATKTKFASQNMSEKQISIVENRKEKKRKRKKGRKVERRPNLDKEYLRNEFQMFVRKLVHVNNFFTQTELKRLQAEKEVDVRSFRRSSSILSVDFNFESDGDVESENETTCKQFRKLMPIHQSSQQGDSSYRLMEPSPQLEPDFFNARAKPIKSALLSSESLVKKSLSFGVGESLIQVRTITKLEPGRVGELFYTEQEITKFRFEKVRDVIAVFV